MKLAEIGQKLEARAAGTWRVDGAVLVQTEFWASPGLDPEVAETFRAATLRVSIERTALGIVGAVIDARPKVSIADELPQDSGSGMWLRRFGADRSIAVPRVVDGVVVAVASVAVREARESEVIDLLNVFLGG